MNLMKVFSKNTYSDEEQALIVKEHLRAYLVLFKSTVIVQYLFPIILSSVFWNYVDTMPMLAWLIGLAALTSLRAYLSFVWVKRHADAMSRFPLYSLLLSFLAGLFWGCTVFAIDFTNYPVESAFLFVVVFGITAGSVGIGSYWVEYFFVYNLTVFSLYIVGFVIGIPANHYLLAGSLVLFLIFMSQITLVFHQGNAENIILGLRNERLAARSERQRIQAETLAESRSKFLAAASHDLRQPLQALNLFLSALRDNDSQANQEFLIERLERSAEGMNELLNGILDMSRLDADTIKPQLTTAPVDNILAKIKQQYDIVASERNITLAIEQTDLSIETDALLFQRVISNLIENALKHANCSTIRIYHLHPNTADEKACLIAIEDDGAGIPQQHNETVFDAFFQLNNPERDRAKGLGLGLSIVKKLTDLLGVTIRLDSQLDKGTRFILEVKRADAQAPQANNSQLPQLSQVHSATPLTMLSDKLIVIIDDEQSILEGLSMQVQGWGASVISADSFDDLKQQLTQDPLVKQIDFILADYRLRDNETGITAIRNIQQLMANDAIPSILLSGDTKPEILQEVAQSGLTLLHKPIKPAQLRTHIQRLLHTA